jgi:hypothetical protein
MAGRAVRYTTWTKGREIAFLEHLAISSNVAAAERVAKMSPGSAYRRRQKDGEFEQAWATALRQGYAQLEHAMLERALRGVPVVKIAKDGTRTETVEYSDRVAITLLNAHRAAATGRVTLTDGRAAKARLTAKLVDMRVRMGGGD